MTDFPLLQAAAPHVEYFEQIKSTNDYLVAAAEGLPVFSVAFTLNQTQGKGRLGRSWLGEPGKTLAISIVLPWPFDSSCGSSWLPIIVGASVADVLRELAIPEISLKWPNDVLCREKKVAGILCGVASGRRAVAGVGLNLSAHRNELPTATSTSLAIEASLGKNIVDVFCATLVGLLWERVGADGSEVSAVELGALYRTKISTIGKDVRVHEPGGAVWLGVAEDLDEHGHLLVRNIESGEMRQVVASDIVHLRH